jgi:1,4-alpha-glucan branching enzyme
VNPWPLSFRHRFVSRSVFSLLVALAVSFGNAQSSRPGMGATPYADALGTGVTFRVWSPNATSVAVRGSFNGWSSTPLAKEAAGDLWSADVPNVANGSQYKYFINGTFWWKDPRARRVTQSGYNNPDANSVVYFPNNFDWQGTTRLPVTQSNLVIYELHVGAFYDSTPLNNSPGKFTDVVAKLNYLTNLGINAIELLPIAEFPGDYSWGYNPADIFAVENNGYGGPDGLKLLVREAHKRGVHVLLDVVHNHYGPSDLELYGFDVGAANRFYSYTNSGICCTPWGDRPNYANPGVRSFITDNFKMWMDEYHIDGFRWDAVGAMRFYDPGYVNIPEADSLIQSINNTEIRANRPGVISIAEDAAAGQGFHGEWNHGLAHTLMQQVVEPVDANRNMNTLWNAINGNGFFRVAFSESHDLAGNLNGPGAQRLPTRIDSGNPDSYFARKRSQLAAATVLTAPALPMLFMGQEMHATNQFADNAPLDWSRTVTHSNVVNFYRDLIHLRRNLNGVSAGLTGPNITSHVVRNDAPWKLLAFHRWGAGANDQVMVIMNFTSNPIPSYWIHTWPASGRWYVNLNSDWTRYGSDFGNYGSSMVNVTGSSGEIAIGPYSVLILSRQAHPELDADGDGLLNGWEQEHFNDPLGANPLDDDDGDGANNLHEQAAGTDPNSAASVLKFIQIQRDDTDVTLQWIGGQFARQIIQRAPDLGGPWTPIFTNPPPTAVTNSLTITNSITAPQYYRIQIQP